MTRRHRSGKQLLRQAVPWAGDARRWTLRRLRRELSAPGTRKEVFESVYSSNHWGSIESASGPGSHLEETRFIRITLPELVERHNITSLLDIPCGDANWIRHVNFPFGFRYVGADVVPSIVEANLADAELNGLEFAALDIVEDDLPRMDAIFCRDCLVHLPNKEAVRALDNIRSSGTRLLISTTFPLRRRNPNVATGGWRPINLQRVPFDLGPPLELLSEGSTRLDGAYADKCLGVWAL